jgi:hypothetical protein
MDSSFSPFGKRPVSVAVASEYTHFKTWPGINGKLLSNHYFVVLTRAPPFGILVVLSLIIGRNKMTQKGVFLGCALGFYSNKKKARIEERKYCPCSMGH